jgi:anti-sigma factor RsiW
MIPEELLMRYHDGELDLAARRRVEELVSRDAVAQAQIERWVLIGDLIREADRARPAPPDLAPAILQRIRGRRARWVRLSSYGGLAAAALLALWVGTTRPGPATSLPSKRAPLASLVPSRAPAPPLDGPVVPAVAIESVDFGSTQGAIFVVSAPNDAETVVVWTLDDSKGGSSQVDL